MNVAEMIEKLKQFDPNAFVLIKAGQNSWGTPNPDGMRVGTSKFQDCKSEERDKMLFIRLN